jgi:hypothetical protein
MSNQEPSETIEPIETGVGWAKAQVRTSGVEMPGKRRLGSIVTPTSSTGEWSEKAPPRIIETVHRPQPEPPPRWRPPQSAREEAERLRFEAAEKEKEAKRIEREHDAKIRKIDALDHTIGLKERELQKFRQFLAELEPDSLGKRFEECYWAFKYHPFDQHAVNQFLIAGNLSANSKRLKTLLESKVAGLEREIAEAEAEVATLEGQLEAANAAETA